jgi:para-nitrobenzyl esterase
LSLQLRHERLVRNTYGDLSPKFLALYPAGTGAEATKSAHAFRTNSALSGARLLARLQTKTGKSKAYWYYFSHASPLPDVMWGGRPAQSWGVYHGSELVYVFNAFPFQDWAWRPVDLKLGDMMSSMWVNFARTGSPNGTGLPEWPPYAPPRRATMILSDRPRVVDAPQEAVILTVHVVDAW